MGERIAGKQDRPSLIIEDPEKGSQKVLIRLPLYLTCKLLLKRVDVNQDGPSLIIEPPPLAPK